MIGFFSYGQSSRSNTANITNSSVALLEQIGNSITNEARKYSYFCDNLTSSSNVQFSLSNYQIFDDARKGEYISEIDKMVGERFSEFIYLTDVQIDTYMGDVFYEMGFYPLSSKDIEKATARAAESNGRDYWTYFTSTKGTDHIVLCRQINSRTNSSRAIGYIFASVSENIFANNTYRLGEFGEGADIFLLDADGNVMSSSNRDVVMGEKLQDEAVFTSINQATAADTGTFSVKLAKGDYLVVYKYIESMSWYAVSAIPYAYINKTSNEIRTSIFIVCTICIVFSFLLSLLVSVSIISPLKEIVTFVKGIIGGNLNVQLNVRGNDELAYLADNLNVMVNRISNLLIEVEKEQKLKREKEIQALQAQINPHFLFNTLNSLKFTALMSRVPVVSDGIGALAELLKNTILDEGYLSTIKEELQNIEHYVLIQRIRYGDSFKIEYDIRVDSEKFMILKFLLQPIVENSIIHGLDEVVHKVTIKISIYQEDDYLMVSIIDDGRGFDESQLARRRDEDVSSKKLAGIGISNVDERIKLNFGDLYGLKIKTCPGCGTEVEMKLPLITEKGETDVQSTDR